METLHITYKVKIVGTMEFHTYIQIYVWFLEK